jgi:hypothetical protein
MLPKFKIKDKPLHLEYYHKAEIISIISENDTPESECKFRGNYFCRFYRNGEIIDEIVNEEDLE